MFHTPMHMLLWKSGSFAFARSKSDVRQRKKNCSESCDLTEYQVVGIVLNGIFTKCKATKVSVMAKRQITLLLNVLMTWDLVTSSQPVDVLGLEDRVTAMG